METQNKDNTGDNETIRNIETSDICTKEEKSEENRKDRKRKNNNQNQNGKKQRQNKQTNKSENGNNFLTKEDLQEATYFDVDGLRHVHPYYYNFQVFAKGRWVGKQIINVMSEEFKNNSREVYLKKIEQGKVLINGSKVTPSTRIKNSDKISHIVHRHEPPVVKTPLKIVFSNDEIVVLDKPSSIPIHPAGRYRHNTIVFILAKELNINPVWNIHRLDRLTSGLLLLAKSKEAANKYCSMIRNGSVKKEYIAKVDGEFPIEKVEVDQPITVNDPTKGPNECKEDGNGKNSKTTFERVHFNKELNESIVKCKPNEGRTHQIRVHLQWLGFPISNDPLYGKGKKAIRSKVKLKDETHFDSSCPDCLNPYLDPDEEQLCLFLHAISYEGPDWKYQTELPEWAKDVDKTIL